ncbi:uncharacterized protein TNCV_2626281 [Trichonephila clavipes]|uniref:Uncharacterized protein n=1 Tax=Trichonephila clavipes TaxID=2585209 RepID=A0A8X6W7I5_TRICX|nr:uncharacterized protein TNCV_2626281 [Trichonephila clavipes]
MENNICNSMILTSRRRHFYLVGQSKHKVGACGVNNQASAVLAGNELPFVAFSLSLSPDGRGYELVSSVRALVPQKFSVEDELMHVKHVEVKSPHVGVMWKFGRGVISSGRRSCAECSEEVGEKGLLESRSPKFRIDSSEKDMRRTGFEGSEESRILEVHHGSDRKDFRWISRFAIGCSSDRLKRAENFILVCRRPPRSPTREAVCRSSVKNQSRRLPGIHPECVVSTTASGRLWGLKIRVYFQSPLKEEDGICKVDKVFKESVVSYRVVEDKATDYVHLKQVLTEQFPVVRNRSELETRFCASYQNHNERPSNFLYELLKIHKQLKLDMREEKLLNHVISRLEPQPLGYVEVRHPQTTSNLLQIIDKYEERFLNRRIRGSS